MATTVKKATTLGRAARAAERPVVYHGIKIAPIAGKRSPVAQAIRDALRTKPRSAHGKPSHA